MNTYTRLKYFLAFFLIAYFIGGILVFLLAKDREKEFLPLFSWFLFYHVPNEKYSLGYSVQIIEVDNKKINPPVLFTDAYGIVKNISSPQTQSIARRLVLGVQRRDEAEVKRLRKVLEQVYLIPEKIKYQLVTVTYNPIERFQNGNYRVDVVSEFEKNK